MVGLTIALFLLLVGVTGVLLQSREFVFGDDDADVTGKPTGAAVPAMPLDAWSARIPAAGSQVSARFPGGRVVELRMKAEASAGAPAAGAAFLFVVEKADGKRADVTVAVESLAITGIVPHPAPSLLLRLHTGAILGDPGKAAGLVGGLGLLALLGSGAAIQWAMVRRCKNLGEGLRKIFR